MYGCELSGEAGEFGLFGFQQTPQFLRLLSGFFIKAAFFPIALFQNMPLFQTVELLAGRFDLCSLLFF